MTVDLPPGATLVCTCTYDPAARTVVHELAANGPGLALLRTLIDQADLLGRGDCRTDSGPEGRSTWVSVRSVE
jgi:hypothetical protein